MRKDGHYKTKKEIWMSTLAYNWIHNFNDDEKISKNKAPNSWEIRVHLKKGQPMPFMAWGPSRTLTSKTFEESCLNTSKKYMF